jgi:CheY-like chemotaxis protein
MLQPSASVRCLDRGMRMPNEKANLLIVDDQPSIRLTLSAFLAKSGYRVRSAEDGFTALIELRNGIPDIILSDLNMPGMSGFELLSVVRQRFPAVQTIAMSGAYSGHGIPPGVAADASYEKGTSLTTLLQIVEAMSRPEQSQPLYHHGALAPIWIPRNGRDPSGQPYVMITCPECLRTFAQVLGEAILSVDETGCAYCHSLIRYAIVKPAEPASQQVFQRTPGTGPSALALPDFN